MSYRGHPRPINEDEYVICQRRGHESASAGYSKGIGPSWSYCRWCGAAFRWTEPEMVEDDEENERNRDRSEEGQ